MENTEEILCWVKADDKRTMLTIGKLINIGQKVELRKRNAFLPDLFSN